MRKRILVVDDDSDVQKVVAGALAEYEVVSAYSVDEALALAGNGVSYELVITDFLMPDHTGDELIGLLRERRRDVRILVLTAHHGLFEADPPDWWQKVAHLPKPCSVRVLRDTVQALIGAPPDTLPRI
jgi:CheY-like chemotaxis protein